ncbi:MAG: hypothetical protein Q4F67_13460 [Propionibacteriaceae bacterium]|nr:hypothetical protein [Propionibacteriaceae bacterium]
MRAQALPPQHAGTDYFMRQLREACLERAGIDVRFVAGMPDLRRQTAELDGTRATERESVIPR